MWKYAHKQHTCACTSHLIHLKSASEQWVSEWANWNRLDPFGWHFMSIWRSMNTILLAYSCENQTQCTQTDEQIEGNDSRLMVMYCDRSACYLCRIVAFVMCVSRKFSAYFNVCASSFRVSASAPIFFLHIIPFHSSEHYFFHFASLFVSRVLTYRFTKKIWERHKVIIELNTARKVYLSYVMELLGEVHTLWLKSGWKWWLFSVLFLLHARCDLFSQNSLFQPAATYGLPELWNYTIIKWNEMN